MKPNVFKAMFQGRALAVMTLTPMLCFAGCATAYKSNPSILLSPRGNAIIATLPTGSEIRVNKNQTALVQALANEVRPISTNGDSFIVLQTTAPLKIATESYILERDERELFYATEILKLRSLLNEAKYPYKGDNDGK